MSRKSWVALSLLGILSGAQVANGAENNEYLPGKFQSGCGANGCGGEAHPSYQKEGIQDDGYGNRGYYLMSEKDLLLELNQKGYQLYLKLSEKAKELARKVASARCNGTNLCKGLNACKTERNDCAGKGACKGLGKCAFSDKNLAVKLVYEKMKKEKQQQTRLKLHGR